MQKIEIIFCISFTRLNNTIQYNIIILMKIYEINMKISDNGKKLVGVDAACCFGGKLAAFCLESSESLYVKAKKVYQKSVEF